MGSPSLADLGLGVQEVRALRNYPPVLPARSAKHPREHAQIAHRRACVVLLSSHYERYIYGLNEAAIDVLNTAGILSKHVPSEIRLLQIRSALAIVAAKEWHRREESLVDLFATFGSHWDETAVIQRLEASPVLEWMKSPKIKNVKRYFGYFGIPDVIAAVTRSDATRRAMERRLQGLVDARNGIAHGDQTIQPSQVEVTGYLDAVDNFCKRADSAMAKRLAVMTGSSTPPW